MDKEPKPYPFPKLTPLILFPPPLYYNGIEVVFSVSCVDEKLSERNIKTMDDVPKASKFLCTQTRQKTYKVAIHCKTVD